MLSPDFETIAYFRKDNGPAIRAAMRVVALWRKSDLLVHAALAIDGGMFKAVVGRPQLPPKSPAKTSTRTVGRRRGTFPTKTQGTAEDPRWRRPFSVARFNPLGVGSVEASGIKGT